MSKNTRYSPRERIEAGMVMFTNMGVDISPRYTAIVPVAAGTEVIVLEIIRGAAVALVRTRGTPPNVAGHVETMHLTSIHP